MADPDGVDWDTCDHDDGCIGVALASGGRCWAHATEEDRRSAYTQLRESRRLDVRGVTITRPLLQTVLNAVRDDDRAWGLTYADFRHTTFLDDAVFATQTFQRDSRFDRGTFEGVALFEGASFQGLATFAGVTFQSHARFDKATFMATPGSNEQRSMLAGLAVVQSWATTRNLQSVEELEDSEQELVGIGDTRLVHVFLRAMAATAFIAGGAGTLLWIGKRDRDTSWYPWPSLTVATRLLSTAAIAAALALVAWIFATTT